VAGCVIFFYSDLGWAFIHDGVSGWATMVTILIAGIIGACNVGDNRRPQNDVNGQNAPLEIVRDLFDLFARNTERQLGLSVICVGNGIRLSSAGWSDGDGVR